MKRARNFYRSAIPACGHLRGARILARLFLGTLALFIVGSFIVPWTQNVPGSGEVVAYAPGDRETPIRAPMNGRVVRWMVGEGDHVEAGQPIAEMSDNDPRLLDRLGRARNAVIAQEEAIETAIEVAEEQVSALVEARDAALQNAELKVRIARDELDGKKQKLLAAKAKKTTAELNLARQNRLNESDLASDRDVELAVLGEATARAEVVELTASVRAAEREVSAATARLAETREKNRASIEKARGQLAKLRAEAGKIDATRQTAETKLARQQQMTITAPRAGRILSVTAREGSEFVKSGQSLALLVPDTKDRAVQIWVDGNDAPLIGKGRKVRLQFEGWPAVQFVGWPSAAVGTFGGEVAFVDAAARADGRFRVVVVPDPTDAPWPEAQYLRQGVRARGWVLLNRVSVAFEIWRQLNGFPPATKAPKTVASSKK